jgi:hypothetical protein
MLPDGDLKITGKHIPAVLLKAESRINCRRVIQGFRGGEQIRAQGKPASREEGFSLERSLDSNLHGKGGPFFFLEFSFGLPINLQAAVEAVMPLERLRSMQN